MRFSLLYAQIKVLEQCLHSKKTKISHISRVMDPQHSPSYDITKKYSVPSLKGNISRTNNGTRWRFPVLDG